MSRGPALPSRSHHPDSQVLIVILNEAKRSEESRLIVWMLRFAQHDSIIIKPAGAFSKGLLRSSLLPLQGERITTFPAQATAFCSQCHDANMFL
jgi:hypothetical protein